MTYEEAKDILCVAAAEVEWNCPLDYTEAFKKAEEALDKQIPKKPTSGVDRTWGTPTKEAICPTCDYALGHWEFIGGGEKITYCEHCGQAIDWSDDNGET